MNKKININTIETLKNIGGCLLYLVLLIGFTIACIFLIKWGADAAIIITPYLSWINNCVLTISLFILTPMAFFRKTRSIAAIGFIISSFIFGLSLWVSGFLVTYAFWGTIGVIIGVLILGIGVVFTAIIALAIHGGWSLLGLMILGIVLTIGTRILGYFLTEKADNEKKHLEPNKNTEVVCPSCAYKNHKTANYCKNCGVKLID